MHTPLPVDKIAAQAVERQRPDGSAYQSLSVAATADLAREAGLEVRTIELAALKQEILPERYARNTHALSLADQENLLRSRACIVGVGGLGGTVAEILARIGVGWLQLVDGDGFEAHNLNRQRFAHSDNLGQPKVEEARRQIARINPAVSVTARKVYLTEANADDLMAEAGVVIDCLDRLDDRRVLREACRRRQLPLVSAAVAGSTGHLTVLFPEDRGWERMIGEVSEDEARGVETRLGNLPFTVSTLASLEAAEAVKVLLGRGGLLRNRLLLVDLMEPFFEIITLE